MVGAAGSLLPDGPGTILGLIVAFVSLIGAGGIAGVWTARSGARNVNNQRQADYDRRQDTAIEWLRDRNELLERRDDQWQVITTRYRVWIANAGTDPDTVASMPETRKEPR